MTLAHALSRRWLAIGSLAVATLMLILGLTAFNTKMSPSDFVVYWMVCLIFTTLAAWLALLDIREIKQHSRDAQRELIEETLRQLEQDRYERGQLE